MALFPRLRLGLRDGRGGRLHQLLQQRAAILEQGGPQTQLGRLQIVDALPGPLPAHQVDEGLRFLEALLLALGRFESFFLLSPAADSSRVI